MRPDTPWIVGFATVIVGWFASSILSYYVPKILSVIGLGASKRLSDLKIRIIPELKKTLCDVDQERMMHRKGKLQSDVEALDKKASMLRHALEDAEDIFDDHHEIEAYRNNLWQSFCSGLKISWGWIAHIVWRGCAWLWRWVRKISFRLSEVTASAVATCAVSCVPVTQIVWSGFSGLSRWARMMSRAGATCVAGFNKSWTVIAGIGQFGTTRLSLLALRGSNGRLPVTNNHTIVHSHQPVRGTNVAASDETIPAEIHSSEGVLDSDAATHDEPVLEICPEALLPNDTSASANNPNAFALLRGSDDTPPITDNYVAHSHQPVPGINVSASDEIIPAEILSESVVGEPLTTSNPPSDEPAVVATNDVIPHGSVREICITRFNMSCMWIASSGPWFSHRWTSMRKWLVDAFEAVRTVRDEVCEGIGFTSRKEDATWIDFVLTAISIWKLKRRIEKVKSTVSYVKESAPLDVAKKSALEDIANKNKSSIRTTNMRTVFGRVAFRHKIVKKLLKRPPSSDRCFSAIGIYGVSGSGKTIFAQYTHDFIKDECKKKDKPFDTIMCVHVSKNFNLNDIFHAMLKDVTGHWQSKTLVREELKDKLQKKLCGKCFFLILDDIWMEDMYNQQLDELLSPLIDGKKGSKILVTTQDEDTAKILCGDETTYKIPDLDDDSFLNLLMHHAQVADGEHGKGRERESFGKLIAEKLHKSPIAAVIVAGRLAIRRDDMEFWQNTALNVKLDDTMDALWWSYQELPLDIRRCLEYCSIFPRRTNLTKTELVRLWIAQGFVSATEDMEDRAEGYVQKLVSRRFLEPTRGHDDCFTIHDRLHDLLDMVVGSDCFRIENERSQKEEGPLRIEKEEGPSRIEKEEGPLRIEEEEGWRGAVRHLFVQNYDAELITETVLGLKNLRTLIIYIVKSDTPVEEMVIESICKRLLKLRVLIIHFSNTIYEDSDRIFRFPKSVGQLKHLRYLGFRSSAWAVILPSTLNKLHHIQQLDFGGMSLVIPNFTGCLVNLLHIICKFCYFPHIGRIISLKTLPCFIVKDEEGYEVKQLRKLNKLRGRLIIYGLENVKSKEQADQANLAVKEQLTELYLVWALGGGTRCSPKDEAEVLEGLCPPMGLQSLTICCYEGSRYPDWMVGQHDGNPKDLQQLHFWRCNQTAPCLEVETFRRLRELWLIYCSWDALPDNMEHLTSLKLLKIVECLNIRSLPTLPQSLEVFELDGCNDELTAEHAIWKNNKRMSRTSSHITDDWDDNFASQGSDHSAAMNSYVRFMMTRLFLP